MTPYFSEGGIQIYLGDCREILPMLRFDVVVTDPPYGCSATTGWGGAYDSFSIAGDESTALRDWLVSSLNCPWVIFGSPRIPRPACKSVFGTESWAECSCILVGMYEKMGRFDCYFCPNQRPAQALKVAEHYPELASEWMAMEARKGHSFMPLPLSVMIANQQREQAPEAPIGCACFGGTENVWDGETETFS